jgi:GNAT superfamily N-acetyltransferase
MEQYRLHSFSRSDAQAAADVVNAASMRSLGFPRAVVDAVGNIWAFRYVNPKSEKIVAVGESHQVTGYAYFSGNDSIVTEMGGAAHPDHLDRGIGSALIEWAEEKALAASQNAPAGVKTVLQTILFDTEHKALKLIRDHGFSPVREWMHLVIELVEPPIVPSLPAGLSLRAMDLDNDWDIVGSAMDEAFVDHWGYIPSEVLEKENQDEEETPEQPVDELYSNTPGYCFIVLAGNKVAGGVLCNAKLVERDDTGRVGSLFVRPAYRGRGIARTLMLASFDAFWKNGLHRVITDTDANSFTISTRLYKSLGMRPYRSELTYEKEVRPGREVRRLGAG